MATEFIYGGMTLTLATPEEFREAVMFGKFISRDAGISTYQYRNRLFMLSDHDLTAARTPQESATEKDNG